MARSAGARSSFIVTAIAIAGLTPLADADQPPPSDRPVTTSMQVPLVGTAAGACQGDLVPLTGELNAVTRVRMMSNATMVDVYFNLNNVKGVGSVSGLRYLGLGTAQFSTQTDRGPPNLPSHRMNFMLWAVGRSPNPCIGDPDKVQPLPVNVVMKFDADGSLAGLEATVRPAGR
jgi:hypothetical protein